MSQPRQPTRYGRIHRPDDAWLARQPPETILDPDLPIIDTHHHLWDRPDFRYLLHDFLADTNTGHNIVATVFLQCHTMYRAQGPEELRPVGETEFVAGIAAMSDSGGYGKTRVAAGIVGYADLTLGDRVEAVLEAQIRGGGGRHPPSDAPWPTRALPAALAGPVSEARCNRALQAQRASALAS